RTLSNMHLIIFGSTSLYSATLQVPSQVVFYRLWVDFMFVWKMSKIFKTSKLGMDVRAFAILSRQTTYELEKPEQERPDWEMHYLTELFKPVNRAIVRQVQATGEKAMSDVQEGSLSKVKEKEQDSASINIAVTSLQVGDVEN